MKSTAVRKPAMREGRKVQDRHPHRAPEEQEPRPASAPVPMPPLSTAFYSPGGRLTHTWCGRPLVFLRRRGGIELDFYCQQCLEHVTLPACILSRIPDGPPASGGPREATSYAEVAAQHEPERVRWALP